MCVCVCVCNFIKRNGPFFAREIFKDLWRIFETPCKDDDLFLVRISEVSEVEGTIRPNTYHGHWNVDLFINFCSSEFFTSEMGIPPKKLLRDATVHIARSELPCLTFVLNVWTFQSVLTRTSAYEGTNGQGVSLRLIGSH